MSEAADDLQRAQREAFAQLTEVGRRLEDDQLEQAAAAAAQLRSGFERRPPDAALAGFATMLLDAALWLLARGRDRAALELCDAVVARLADGTPAELAATAGAYFLGAQAAGRLGLAEISRSQLEALCGMGEPALAALDRLAGRLSAGGASPAWHAQVAAASVTVLWRLGRVAEARAIAQQAAAAFARAGLPELEARLRALEREIAGPGVE